MKPVPWERLQGVGRTLMIPLMARAHGAALLPGLGFVDEAAQEVAASAPWSLREISRDLFPMRLCIGRSVLIQRRLEELLRGRADRVVVLLACGLDTLPQRIRSPKTRWLCGDLAPVIGLRQELLPATETIAHEAIELPEQLDAVAGALQSEAPIVILEGILPYLEPQEVSRCLEKIAALCPSGADLLVDSYHPTLLAFAEMGATFRRMQVGFRFGLEHPRRYAELCGGLEYHASWDLLALLPWYTRKRCLLPRLLVGSVPLATVCHLKVR